VSVREEIGPAKSVFVFARGGSFAAIQVDMLHSLAAHGVAADMVVGSSVGATERRARAVTLHCKSDRFIKAANYFFEPTSLP
jgi:predicted acylesterase/phospholipase RssA